MLTSLRNVMLVRSKAARVLCGGTGRRALSAEADGKHVPYGEAGSGFYSDNTRGCYDVMDRLAIPTLEMVEGTLAARAARGAEKAGEPYTIMDMGTADAGTSMGLVGAAIQAVRAAEPSTQVVVVYEDQAGNDWNSVFKRVHNMIPGAVPSYKTQFEGDSSLVVYACGDSFYATCAPDNSVDLCMSSTAMHWLTACPATIPDALHSACSNDPAASEAFKAQARTDWAAIWAKRAAELKVGGAAAVANFAKDTEGRFLGTSQHVGESMHHTFAALWQELVDEGAITAAEFTNTNFPNQYRSLDDCAEVFHDPNSEASKRGLRWVGGETDLVRCPYHERWLREGGDAAAHATRYIPTTRTWSNSTLVSGLDAAKRSQEERDAIVDEMFARYEARVAADPDNHAMDYTHSYIKMVKE